MFNVVDDMEEGLNEAIPRRFYCQVVSLFDGNLVAVLISLDSLDYAGVSFFCDGRKVEA